MTDLVEIASYVLLDLETTGLPGLECGTTKITELSMVAVLKKHLENQSKAPRVQNKLTLCFHPQKFISDGAARVTALSNELLEGLSPFNLQSYQLIEHFLGRLPKPICLIAHNGIKFDFPLLQAHVMYLGKKFPADMLCADSLVAFRELKIVEDREKLESPNLKELSPKKMTDTSNRNNRISIPCAGSKVEHSLTPKSNPPKDIPNIINTIEIDEIIDPKIVETVNILETLYGTTPKQNKLKTSGIATPRIRRAQPAPETTPLPHHQSQQSVTPRGKAHRTVRKQLFTHENTPSYRLGNIYKHLKGCPIPNVHSAEGDALALLECIAIVGKPFHDWVLTNNKKFSAIIRAW